jgi:PEP-CTERM motif
MNTASRLACLALALGVAMSATNAQAGPLPLDPNAIWHGTSAPLFFSISGGGTTFEISASVQYAVYNPGKFDLSFGAGADPSNGSQYVYAYQVYNTGANGPTTVAEAISFFSVGLGANANAQNIEALPLVNGNFGQLPSSESFGGSPPNSAGWFYSVTPLGLAAQSQILLFTSPHGPTYQSSGVTGNGLSASQPLPSPAPEPSSVILLVMGGLVALVTRRRWSKR